MGFLYVSKVVQRFPKDVEEPSYNKSYSLGYKCTAFCLRAIDLITTFLPFSNSSPIAYLSGQCCDYDLLKLIKIDGLLKRRKLVCNQL